ncbi:MAG: IPT/TIG domain-containing protein [Bdellovibrionales bacterium]|nr:IPT/TIG domain-containing protein [Bdellovibrionales bacterium]
MNRFACFSILVFIALGDTFAAVVDPINPQELVTRCFSVFNLRLSPKDPRRASIQSRTSALALCNDLVDSPKILTTSGFISTAKQNITPEEAKQVARRIQQFHESFFKNDDFRKVLDDTGFARLTYDSSLAPGYFTWAFLKSNFRLAVTESSMLRIIRDQSVSSHWGNLRVIPENPFQALSQPELTVTVLQVYDPKSLANAEEEPHGILLRGVDRGLLRGIKTTFPNDSIHFYGSAGRVPSNIDSSSDSILWQRTLGAGYLGEPAFLLLNLGLPYDRKSDGALVMARRWSHELMNTALCKKGPYLKQSQIPNNDILTGSDSAIPSFRKNLQCLACHSNSDPLSSSLRNISLTHLWKNYPLIPSGLETNTGNVDLTGFHHFINRYEGPVIQGQSYWRSSSDANFFRRSGSARLAYTSAIDGGYRESLIPISLESDSSTQLQALGQTLANEDDYYFCGLVRYFSMISGIQLESDADSFPNLPSGSPALHSEMWEYLKALTAEFKANGDPKWAIKKIFATEYFRSRSWKRFQSNDVQISSISPSAGSVEGGTQITIEGANFSASTEVFLGTEPCVVNSFNDSSINCTTPPLPAGSPELAVTVQVIDGIASDTYSSTFNYALSPRLSHIRNYVFSPHCQSCHGQDGNAPHLNQPSHAYLLNFGNLISPNHPENSELYKRITGTSDPRMPMGGPYLSNEIQAAIHDWIQSGAEDN